MDREPASSGARKFKYAHQRDLISPNFPMILIIMGLILIGIWGLHRYFYNRSLSLSSALVASYKSQRSQVSYPIHITIGNKISLHVVEETLVNGTLVVSPTDANHLLASALPGEPGNIIMYGHNLNSVFGYLVDARVGDPVRIYTDDGRLHAYKISEINIVDPTQTALLAPEDHEVLTLYTCTGLLDSLRFVARAIPTQ